MATTQAESQNRQLSPEDRARAEMTAQMYQQALPLSYMLPVIVAILYVIFLSQLPTVLWTAWMVANLLVGVWRFLLTQTILKSGIHPDHTQRPEKHYLILEIASAICIGSTMYFITYLLPAYQILIYLLVVGTTTGSVVLISSSLRVNLAFIATNTITASLWLLYYGEPYFYMLVVMGLSHALLMAAATLKLNKTLFDSFDFRFINEYLLKEKNKINDELLLSKSQLEEAYKAKSNFLSNISHEIRTPLNAIMGIIELLKRSRPEQLPSRMLETASSAADGLLHLLNNLLDLSKNEVHSITIEKIPFDINELMTELTDILRVEANNKGIELSWHGDSGLPKRLLGDPLKLTQIINNLGSNAIKFTAEGRVDFSVSEFSASLHETQILIEVSDTGVGVPASKQDEIFKPFTQADDSTTRAFGGTGLGLAIVKQLVEKMKGELGVNSTPGEGATFWVKLPFLIDRRKEEILEDRRTGSVDRRKPMASYYPPYTHSSNGSQLDVLLVEDNEANQLVAQWTLEHLGMKVSCAENGVQALDQIDHYQYDIIFMDCQMPIMDGFEATAKIRQKSSTKNMIIIAMTANTAVGDKEKCLAAGMNGYISKPVRIDSVESEVKRMIPDWEPTVSSEEMLSSSETYSS